MKNYNNKKALILMTASLALAAPMAMAQVASPAKTTTDATAATQVNDAHDQARAQGEASTQTTTTAPLAPPAAPTAQASEAGQTKWSDLDGDGNGTLNAAEAKAMPSLDKIFAEADANADGELSQDEYKAWAASNSAASTKPGDKRGG